MLIILSGVSGAGKDTIKTELLKRNNNMTTLPSYTTRPMREGEVNGVIYNFVSEEEFKKLIANNDLYEYDIHHDNYYGTSRTLLNEKIAEGKVIIKDIDVNGTENLVKLLKDDTRVVTIFLRVPKDALKQRLINRGTNTPEEIEERLSRFDYEESKLNQYDFVIKNNDLEKTIQIIEKIISEELKVKEVEF